MRTFALLLLAVIHPVAGAWRHDRDRAVFRALGASPALGAVGRLEINGEARRGGSGTLIDRAWVLTAAHVVDRWRPGEPWRFAWGTEAADIAEVVLHPGWHDAPDLDARVDLALVRLASPISAVAPMALDTGIALLGRRVVISGHGFAQPANTLGADQTPPGEKYAGYNVIDSLTANHAYYDIDSPTDPSLNVLGAAEPDSLEYGGLGGDSGGGVVVVVDGVPRLVAVNGSVQFTVPHVSRHGWYGLPNRLNRVAPHRAWITATMGAARRGQAGWPASGTDGAPREAAGPRFSAPCCGTSEATPSATWRSPGRPSWSCPATLADCQG